MKDGWREPYKMVCYNIELAQTFTKRAEQGGIAPDISPWSCLVIVAGALWSAVDIFNDKVASRVEEKLTSKKGKGISALTEAWFEEHEPLVDLIRNGVVHADRRPSGLGQTVNLDGPTTKVASFVWEKSDDGDYQDTPVAEVLSQLNKVADQIKDHVVGKTEEWYISFG